MGWRRQKASAEVPSAFRFELGPEADATGTLVQDTSTLESSAATESRYDKSSIEHEIKKRRAVAAAQLAISLANAPGEQSMSIQDRLTANPQEPWTVLNAGEQSRFSEAMIVVKSLSTALRLELTDRES